jgi:hypothetical protein
MMSQLIQLTEQMKSVTNTVQLSPKVCKLVFVLKTTTVADEPERLLACVSCYTSW